MLKTIHDKITLGITRLKRNRQIKPEQGMTKVNLGAGLIVAPGWYNIDGHMRTFFSTWPIFVLKLLYRVIQTSNQQYTEEEYCRILKTNRFIHHDLKYGVPFPNGTVDFLYASHLLEHLHKDEAERLVREGFRVLKKGGVFRVCVPDLAYAFSLYQKGVKVRSLDRQGKTPDIEILDNRPEETLFAEAFK
jgi:SAM-dependent methyltransferase